MEIRRATVEDIPGIARIRVLTWQDAYRDIVHPEVLSVLSIERDEVRLRERMNHPEGEKVYRAVAIINGSPAGFAVAGLQEEPPHAGEFFLFALYVLPELQGQGAGRALLDHILEVGKAQGHTRMFLGVFTENQPAKRFYEGTGGSFLHEGTYEIQGRSYPTDTYVYDL